MTATGATAVTWPAWEDASFYMQEPAEMYASIAAQRHAAPVYWYEPRGYPTGFAVGTIKHRPGEINEITVRPLDAFAGLKYLRARPDDTVMARPA